VNTLRLDDVSKTYGLHPILNHVSLALHDGERIGLVGANGVGKSTLIKIITGEVAPDAGGVTLAPNIRVGYLAQVMTGADDQTLAGMIDHALALPRQLEARLRDLEGQLSTLHGDDLSAALSAYGDTQEAFERIGGYDLDSRLEANFAGLNIAHLPRDQAYRALSGGEKTRVGLALLLLDQPDLLLLDEPTNHLDFHSMTWLEKTLAEHRGAALLVSHDRRFLNRTATAILEIDEHTHTARRYAGSYDNYRRAKQQERRQWELDHARQQEEIKALKLEIRQTARRNDNYRTHSDNDKMILHAKQQTHDATVSKRVRVAEEKLARIEANPIPRPPQPLRFNGDFDPHALSSRYPLTLYGISKRYGERTILDDIHLTLSAGGRVVIIGDNGAGKTTLLRVIAGSEQPDAGERSISPAVKIGYLDQEAQGLDPSKPMFEAFRAGLPLEDQPLKTLLFSMGLFRYDELDKRAGDLSAGQKRKLQLARLIAGGANLLVLDEPTNFLSLDVVEAFEAALKTFGGAIIAASHDRHFIETFGGDVWALETGKLHPVGERLAALA
jgi:macrolide transport system ATP-binding/permease protein